MTSRRFYQHRINTVEGLRALPPDVGLELDLRSDGPDVLVTHDPFTRGPTIETFFAHIGQRPCIFNVKCEGIEARVLDVAARCGVSDFFFLDLSVPAAWKLAQAGERRLAVRWSEVEPLAAVQAWRGLASWVWIDCFSVYPGDAAQWLALQADFRLCVVSPELQRHDEAGTARLLQQLADKPFDAVCSKLPARWRLP